MRECGKGSEGCGCEGGEVGVEVVGKVGTHVLSKNPYSIETVSNPQLVFLLKLTSYGKLKRS